MKFEHKNRRLAERKNLFIAMRNFCVLLLYGQIPESMGSTPPSKFDGELPEI